MRAEGGDGGRRDRWGGAAHDWQHWRGAASAAAAITSATGNHRALGSGVGGAAVGRGLHEAGVLGCTWWDLGVHAAAHAQLTASILLLTFTLYMRCSMGLVPAGMPLLLTGSTTTP